MPDISHTQIQLAVCDDEPADRRSIAALAEEILQNAGISCAVSLYSSAPELLAAVSGGKTFQILLLDVVMDGMSGMDLAAALRRFGDRTAIVFISSNREMAMRGYEVSAVRYLAKPVQPDRLQEALLFCCRTCGKKELLLPTSRGQRRISYSDVVYAEAAERMTKLFLTHGREETVNMKFSDLEAMLPGRQFVLSHRSYLVNLEYVSYVRSRELELSTGAVLPVSRYRLDALQKRMVDYFSG